MPTKSGLVYLKFNSVFIALLLVLLFYLVTQKVYTISFAYGDDYRLLVMTNPAHAPAEFIKASKNCVFDVAGSLQFDFMQGRFRPLAWVWTSMEVKLFGANASYYHWFNLLILFFSVWLFYLLLKCLKSNSFIALLITLVFIFGKNAETWWSLIPPAQNIGELLLLAAIYFLARQITVENKSLFILSNCLLIAASGIKETFALIAPFILLLYWVISKKKLTTQLKLIFLLNLLPLFCLFLTVSFSGKIYGYENLPIVEIFFYNIKQVLLSLCFLLAPMLYLLLHLKAFLKNNKLILKISALTVLIVFTQLILLVKIKMEDQHHYLMPMILIPLVITAVSLTQLKTTLGKYLYYGGSLIYFLFMLNNLKNTYVNSSYYSAKITAFYNMLDFMKQSKINNFVYVNSTCGNNDWLAGTSVILKDAIPSATISHYPITDCDKLLDYSYKTITEDKIDEVKPIWVMFELPEEKGLNNYPIQISQNGIEILRSGKSRAIKGKVFVFEATYPDIRTAQLLKLNFEALNNNSKLRYKAICIR